MVEQDTYLMELSRYVVLNPLYANMIKNISAWKWSSYHAMIGEVPVLPWLEVNWLLGQFSKQQKRAIVHYINFVREGSGLPSIWSDLKNQIFMASENFINDKITFFYKKETTNKVLILQKRKSLRTSGFYKAKYNEPKKATYNVYLTGAYTLK